LQVVLSYALRDDFPQLPLPSNPTTSVGRVAPHHKFHIDRYVASVALPGSILAFLSRYAQQHGAGSGMALIVTAPRIVTRGLIENRSSTGFT